MFSSRSRKGRYRVAIEGFSDVERAALASFLRLTERRVPGYVQVTRPDDSDFLIADADQSRVLAWVARERRIAETVFIGEQAPDAALAWLTRPIESGPLMRALDTLLGGWTGARQPPSKSEQVAPAPPPAVAAAMNGGDDDRMAGVGSAGARVLVAASATNTRGFLAQRLAELGYRVSIAGSSDEALDCAAWTAFSIAFIDLDLRYGGGLDSLQLCQKLKRYKGAEAMAVVITTGGRGGATDRVRASLAGCDIYLSKPLLDADLHDVLRQLDPSFPGASGSGDG